MINVKERCKKKEYPKLMVSVSNAIYLMVNDGQGTVIKESKCSSPVGYYTELVTQDLSDYNEPLTIQNK